MRSNSSLPGYGIGTGGEEEEQQQAARPRREPSPAAAHRRIPVAAAAIRLPVSARTRRAPGSAPPCPEAPDPTPSSSRPAMTPPSSHAPLVGAIESTSFDADRSAYGSSGLGEEGCGAVVRAYIGFLLPMALLDWLPAGRQAGEASSWSSVVATASGSFYAWAAAPSSSRTPVHGQMRSSLCLARTPVKATLAIRAGETRRPDSGPSSSFSSLDASD